MLATELHRLVARMWMPADLGGPSFHTFTRLVVLLVLLTNVQERDFIQIRRASYVVLAVIDEADQYFVCDKANKEVRHKDRFFVTSTPEAQTRPSPRLVQLLFRLRTTSAR